MSRRHAREAALLTLFQLELNPPQESADFDGEVLALDAAVEETHLRGKDDYDFAANLVHGTRAVIGKIDDQLKAHAKSWSLERMAGVDRNIVRIALYELLYADEPMDTAVAISEAVELAKIYGTDESARYVNGVLGEIVRSLDKA
ncbi:transcription antitermination factor NusB [Selenomonas sp. TAMA-11512]|uniref:transcription antitermination factor NusB n=1 Tax=Selenomonas sp. TAMA-11512 TaxID=3095337 RepID=UPI003088C7C3|nr:transcription antitermination factor NusB [Selenomonas sp. TAMA-11512]